MNCDTTTKASASFSPGVVLGTLAGLSSGNWCIDATHPDGDRAKENGDRFTTAEGHVEEG